MQAMERMRREVAEKQPDTQLSLESLPLDLSSFRSTQEFVAAFKARNCPLHILINNAGIAMTPQGRVHGLIMRLYVCSCEIYLASRVRRESE